MEARLYDKYVTEVVPALQQKFGYKNVNQIPKVDKIVINMGLGNCKDNPKALEAAVKELEAIAGQKAMVTKAKKSIANFKLREGMNVGAKVTLRGERMDARLPEVQEGCPRWLQRAGERHQGSCLQEVRRDHRSVIAGGIEKWKRVFMIST